MIEISKLNGINPQAYLDILARIANGHPVNDELLPWNYVPHMTA